MPQDITGVKTYKALIRWLAERHHAGHFFPMAERIGVSSALVDQWKRGVVKNPTIESITKLCLAYDLDLLAVLRLVTARISRPPRDLSSISGGSALGSTPQVRDKIDDLPLIRRILRGYIRALLWPTLPQPCPQWA